jgi:hypothetical protein
VRAPDIEAEVRQQKEKLVAEADAWRESIAFVVETETDGRLGYRLAEAFGIIPTIVLNVPAKKRIKQEVLERQQQAMEIMIKIEAMRRASLPPLENEEREKSVHQGSQPCGSFQLPEHK